MVELANVNIEKLEDDHLGNLIKSQLHHIHLLKICEMFTRFHNVVNRNLQCSYLEFFTINSYFALKYLCGNINVYCNFTL